MYPTSAYTAHAITICIARTLESAGYDGAEQNSIKYLRGVLLACKRSDLHNTTLRNEWLLRKHRYTIHRTVRYTACQSSRPSTRQYD